MPNLAVSTIVYTLADGTFTASLSVPLAAAGCALLSLAIRCPHEGCLHVERIPT